MSDLTLPDSLWEELREALIAVCPERGVEEQREDTTRSLKQFLLTGRARAALSPDTYLVIGDRGAGKTALCRLLADPELRQGLPLPDNTVVRVGFARRQGDTGQPDADSLHAALKGADLAEHRLMWLGLLGRALLEELKPYLDAELIEALAQNDPRGLLTAMEAKSAAMYEALAKLDERLHNQGRSLILVYDDLDLLMPTWESLFGPIRGLFALWQSQSRVWRRLRPKVFLRKDLFDSEAMQFPDGAKFFATRQSTLMWSEADLYALLVKRLLNHEPNSEALHRWLVDLCGGDGGIGRGAHLGIFPKRAEGLAFAFVRALAGPTLGEGVTASPSDSWVMDHITDGAGEASPRSLLRMFRRAAELARDRLQPGVCVPSACFVNAQRVVSEARVEELMEEDHWIGELPRLLRGATIPAAPESLQARLAPLLDEENPAKRPRCETAAEVVDRLLRRGLLTRRGDGRLDVPELYRAGLGLTRDVAPDLRPTRRMTPTTEQLVDRLFCERDAPYGPYQLPSLPHEEVVIPELLVRARLIDSELQPVTVQLYHGLDTIGGELWSREVRALMQLTARKHPALPSVRSGGHDETHDVAFVITDAAEYTLAEPNAMEHIAKDPVEALRQLLLLTHGLSLLHERGITHRNLSPATVEYLQHGGESDADNPAYSLRLARFEMSTMVSNALRRQLHADPVQQAKVRGIYHESLQRWLPYCPPERAEWLLGPSPDEGYLESDREDVYALGVMAWRWLVEPQVRAAALRREAAALWDACTPTPEGARAARVTLVQGLTSALLPRELKDVLSAMLEADPLSRLSVAEVLRRLGGSYGNLAAALSPEPDSRPYFVGFMPEESHKTLLKWGWIEKDPNDPTGQEELKLYLQRELEGAELLYSPEGFTTFRTPQNDKERRAFRDARYVLRGRQGFWFCDLYFPPGPAFRAGGALRVDQILLIKYVCAHRHAWRLDESPLRRKVPGTLRLIPVWASRSPDLEQISAQAASWRPLMRSVELRISRPKWLLEMDQALTFLVQLRKAQLDARCFPVNVSRAGENYTLTVDVERDRKHGYGDALRTLYFRTSRLPLGRLCQSTDDETGKLTVFYQDGQGRADYTNNVTVFLKRVLDNDSVEVTLVGKRDTMPPLGWVRPFEDHGEAAQQRRQAEATDQLRGMIPLLQQLHDPRSIVGMRGRWARVGRDLKGRSPEIVLDMLRSSPFFALHGPPGTGKTTVAAAALVATLQADPGLRALITSQSHYALDNLGERVLKECRERRVAPVAIRVASREAESNDKVSGAMSRYLPERQAEAQIAAIQRAVERAVHDQRLPDGTPLKPELGAVLTRWAEQAPRVLPELRDRLRRGANLVFATTGASTEKNLGIGDPSATFDWVVVEEAARAWPTELALPLVKGRRWTLIGDHLQLPAFDEMTIERVLKECIRSDDDELRAHGEHAEVYRRVYRLFGSLFDGRASRNKDRLKSQRLREPLDELDMQFRMHPDIAAVVSRAFYNKRVNKETGELQAFDKGWLKSDERTAAQAHGLHAPAFLSGRALIWLDTEGCPDRGDQRPAWKNDGEVEIVRRLLSRVRPAPSTKEEERFALLTPYLRQRDALDKAALPPWAKAHIYSVDSFQGREADIVVVSMVRDTKRGDESPESDIGYLVSPNRVNVMLSRARSLLVIVGRFEHFATLRQRFPDREDIRFWAAVCDEVTSRGARVSAKDTLYGGGDP